MTDIFDEVQEDVRREQLKKLWQRWGVYIVAAAVVVVLAVAGWRAWIWYTQRQAAAAGAKFESALALARDDKGKAAVGALDRLAADAPGGYRLLARFRAAAAIAASDPKAAVAALDAIAADGGVSSQMKDLAKLRAAMLLLGLKDRAGVEAHAQALAAPGNPWRNSAREILALAAWQAGDLATTEKIAQEMVADAGTPQSVRQRASVLLDLAASAEAAKKAPHPAAAPPAAASGPELPAIETPAAPLPAGAPAQAAPAAPPASTSSPAAPPAH
ncbi:MAG TPA: tetratricopeptide repeat protein [Hyphomicrobiales bacterium]|nr:tetratricopeptide repeat protein [Hyphomicrobiales bacterium]